MRDQTRRDETTLQISTVLAVFVLALAIGAVMMFLAHLVGLSGDALETGFWLVSVGAAVVSGAVGLRTGRP